MSAFITVTKNGVSIEIGTDKPISYSSIKEWKEKGAPLGPNVLFSSTVDCPGDYTSNQDVIKLARFLRGR